ncbi:MAG: dephospho-CoA kinase [Alphaproteobacteria bacterium]|nr:dephospho-CoA kinase [Alphaproteobacteria bacterium]
MAGGLYVLGLSGSIGMGKSWAARCFRKLGVPVHDADACVHRLLGPGGAAVRPVADAFAGVMADDGGIDRAALGACVFANDELLARLEHILHPRVRADQRRFLAERRREGHALAVLDIPLLYETGAHADVDAVVVMSAPGWLQRQRVLRRPGMTAAKLDAILARQLPDAVKRRAADFVVSTGGPRGESLRAIAAIVKLSRTRRGRVWSPAWGR